MISKPVGAQVVAIFLQSGQKWSVAPCSAVKRGRAATLCTAKPLRTIGQESQFCQEIRKSKFVGFAAPAQSIGDAMAYLNKVMDPKATHNCWAYRSNSDFRCSDDGEPGGTAGRPMLNILVTENLVNTVVVVTRYYGGIKLGTGGLARAYASTAKGALEAQELLPVVPACELEIVVKMDHVGFVYSLFEQWSSRDVAFRKTEEKYVTVLGVNQDETRMVYHVRIAAEAREDFENSVRNVCKGESTVRLLKES